MGARFKDEDFQRLDHISKVLKIPRRTIEYHISRFRKSIGEDEFKKYYKDYPRADGSRGRRIRKYHQPTIKRIFDKNAQSTNVIRVRNRKELTPSRQALRSEAGSMTPEDMYNIVQLICNLWLQGDVNLLDAVEDQGITLGLFFKMVNSQEYILKLFNSSREKWISTHGHHLQHLAYSKLIRKMQATHITKVKTSYITVKNKNGRLIKRMEREVVERMDFHPSATDILLTKKFYEEIALLNPSEPNIVDDRFEDKSIEELERDILELEKMVEQEKQMKFND